jgi:hypothetical protein
MTNEATVPQDNSIAAKRKKAAADAIRTATWAKTMTKVVISQNNGKAPFWHVINFLGPGKAESVGVVDLIAIRKNHKVQVAPLKRGDLFEFVLIQVKGGSARWPTTDDRERLRAVGKTYNAKAILLSEWKKGSMPVIYELSGDEWGDPINPAKVFGPPGKANGKAQSDKTLLPKSATKKIPKVSKSTSTEPSPSSKSSAAKKAWATRKTGLLINAKS